MAGVRYQLTPLDGTGLRYTLKRFEGASPETSHVIAPEWERRLTARTTASVSLGPRFSEEAGTGAEASASLRHDFQQATASMAYRRTQELVTGRTGAQATDALTGDVSISLLQNLTLFVRGMFLHTSVETPPANDVQVYAATVNLTYQITAWARARIAYGYYFQQQDSGDIRHHIISVGLDLSRRFRVR
jgi:hypothetical protein